MRTALLSIFLLLIAITFLPLVSTLIYKIFYNRHLNKVLSYGEPETDPDQAVKKWISPGLLFFLILLIEVILFVVAGMLSFKKANGMADDSSVEVQTLTQEAAENSIYENFDGSDVAGYLMDAETDGDFSYELYCNENSDELPAYVLRVTYTGPEEVYCWSDNIHMEYEVNASDNGTMSEFSDVNDRTIYVVIGADVPENYRISYILDLYHETMEECNTGELGTYNMPNPAAEFTVQIQ